MRSLGRFAWLALVLSMAAVAGIQAPAAAVPSTTTVVTSPNPSTFGDVVTITATVVGDGSSTPTGTVTFVDNTVNPSVILGSSALGGGGVATLQTTTLSVGVDDIAASYFDGNFDPSIGTTTHTVNKAPTMTALAAPSPNPAVFGQPVALIAAVGSEVGTPTGTVTFVETTTNTTLGTSSLAGPEATLITNAIPAGARIVVATYNGSDDFETSLSNAQPITVTQGSTVTALADAPDPSVFGELVTVTAVVAPVAPSTLTPQGLVTFIDTTVATVLGTVALDAGGQAVLTTTGLPLSTSNVLATYGGSTGYTSSSDNQPHTVNPAPTFTGVTSSAATSVFGQPVTLTAAVGAAPSTAVPTGTVTFTDSAGGTPIAPVLLDDTGEATVTLSNLTLGAHPIAVTYTPDTANFLASTLPTLQVVNAAPTTTSLTASPSPGTAGANVVMTATVDSGSSAVAPVGNVAFVDTTTGTSLGTAAVSAVPASLEGDISLPAAAAAAGDSASAAAVGGASISTTALGVGSHTITATFTPSSPNFTASTDSVVLQVDPAPTTTPTTSTTTTTTTTTTATALPTTGAESGRTATLAMALTLGGVLLLGVGVSARSATRRPRYRHVARPDR